MARSDTDRRVPGQQLLKVARLIFDESTLTSLICPALADFQHEMREAGANPVYRLFARGRGYSAFWRLIMMMPLAYPDRPLADRIATVLMGKNRMGPLAIVVVGLFASVFPLFGWFVLAAGLAGVVMAVVMRSWYDGHPTMLPPAHPRAASRHPQINLSSIAVEGNAGGLIFAAGTVAIVFIGFPDLRWFLVGALMTGGLFAAALLRWRMMHPSRLECRNSIVLR